VTKLPNRSVSNFNKENPSQPKVNPNSATLSYF